MIDNSLRTRQCEQCPTEILIGQSGKKRFCDTCALIRRRGSDKSRQSARRASNGHAEKYRDWTLMKRYGITRKTYDSLLKLQNHCCAICKAKSSGQREWSVDHNHETGEVRGILCGHCNRMLGQARDNVQILKAAIHFLENPTSERLAA